MKVLICDPISQDILDALESTANLEIDLIQDLNEEGLVAVIPSYNAIVVRGRTTVTGKVIEAASGLELIVRGGVGLDNVDLEAAKAKGITVANTPGMNSESVAELAIGFLLCLARQIPRAHAGLAAGRWEKKQFRGHEINGKTLGIIGMGRIGRAISQKAAALGMSVVGFDPYVDDREMNKYGAKAVILDKLRRHSDFITIHVPINEETRNLVDADFLAGAKDGVYIINCARGGVVDEVALLDALKSGKVTGAALDVFTDEPPGPSPLFEHERVIGTPHIGAATFEAQERVGKEIVRILTEKAAVPTEVE